MVNDYNLLIDPKPYSGLVHTAGKEALPIKAKGDVLIWTESGEISISNVLFVPSINVKLFSTMAVTDEGARVTLDYNGGNIIMDDGTMVKITKNRDNHWLELAGTTWRAMLTVKSPQLFDGVQEELEEAKPKPKMPFGQLWHERFGHPGRDKTNKLLELFKGAPGLDLNKHSSEACSSCHQAKGHRANMGKGSGERSAEPLDLLHIDLIIDSSKSSLTEYSCTLVAVDDHSKYVYAVPLEKKSDAFPRLKDAIAFLELQSGKTVKMIRSDNGGEWISNDAAIWAHDRGIVWQKTIAGVSEQNGRVERMNRTLEEKMRALLVQRHLPRSFWPHAMKAAAFIINLLPNVDGEIPYERMLGRPAKRWINMVKVFGCLAWVHIPKVKRSGKKTDVRAVPAIFIGYSLERKGWLFFSPEYSPNIFWSNSASFLEGDSWEDRTEWIPQQITAPKAPTIEGDIPDLGHTEETLFDEKDRTVKEITIRFDKELPEPRPRAPSPDPIGFPAKETRPEEAPKGPVDPPEGNVGDMGDRWEDMVEYYHQDTGTTPEGPPRAPTEPPVVVPKKRIEYYHREAGTASEGPAQALTRPPPVRKLEVPPPIKEFNYKTPVWRPVSRINLRTGKPWDESPRAPIREWGTYLANLPNQITNFTPTVREALEGEHAEEWKRAMKSELEGLEAMGTWEVVNRPPGVNIVDSKMVLKVKTDANLKPTKFKARFVARGFSQREGLDFEEIFAPTVPLEAIRGILQLAAVHDWEVDSIDVTQAYLNSRLHHDVYLKPPDSANLPPGKVYKLVKGLYGLKQSGREWNKELESHLVKIGFKQSPSTPCIYVRGEGDSLTVITAYVDDMLIASPRRDCVDRAKGEIRSKWKIEDSGPVSEFLGIRITRDRENRMISLDQAAYIKNMVKKWLPRGEKTWSPMPRHIDPDPGRVCDPIRMKEYQSLVGQLLWLQNTVRPDICHPVSWLARYMSNPLEDVWQQALTVLKYLNQTADDQLVLGLKRDMERPVVTYTDANWASDKSTDRKSTSGAMTFIYGGLVSWKSHVQKCVALSAVEAEIIAASDAAKDALFFSYLLRDLGIPDVQPTVLTDSLGCVHVSRDPAKHWKLKHVDTRYFFIRDRVQNGELAVEHVGTALNSADVLTKPFARVPLRDVRSRIGMVRPPRGTVEDTSFALPDVTNSAVIISS